MIENNRALGSSALSVSSSARQSALTSDFDTFLKMLTAQAKYQDPLEPLDSTEYAAQLAQFSMVEQQVQTNEQLQLLNASLVSDHTSSLANWVGAEVRSAAPVSFDGAPIEFFFDSIDVSSDSALILADAKGNEVLSIALEAGETSFVWHGNGTNGLPVSPGALIGKVVTFRDGETIDSQVAEHYAFVREARLENGEIQLVLTNGQEVSANQISALRRTE